MRAPGQIDQGFMVEAFFFEQQKGDLRQTPGDDHCGGVGVFAAPAVPRVQRGEAGRVADGVPGGLDEGPAQPFVAMA